MNNIKPKRLFNRQLTQNTSRPKFVRLPPIIKFVKTHEKAQLPKLNKDNRGRTTEDDNLRQIYLNKYQKSVISKCRNIDSTLTSSINTQINKIDFSLDENNNLRGTHDSGYDVFACENTIIPARGSAVVPVGLKVGYISPGWWFRIESRSGLSFKYSVMAHPGIIDNGYRGSLDIKLYNHSDKDYQVNCGDRIAQLVIYMLFNSQLDWIEEAIDSNRGDKGIGSSGN